MKAYRDKRVKSNLIYLKIENPRDKQIAFQLNATIKEMNLAVLPVDVECKETIVGICDIFLQYNVLVDESTNDFLKRALTRAVKRENALKAVQNEVNSIKNRLHNGDNFQDYTSVCDRLLPHQKAGAMIANIYNRYAFYYDTGTGKTVLALEVIAQKEQIDNASFLIICPKTIIKTAWMSDSRRYYPKLKLLPLSKNYSIDDYKKLYLHWNKIDKDITIEEKFIPGDKWDVGSIHKRLETIKGMLLPRAKHYIVNPELFKVNMGFYKKLNIKGLVVDESAMLKNYRSEISVEVRKFSERLKYVYLLSGKPAPNHTLEYFPQMKIIDPKTFSMTYGKHINDYYRQDGYTYSFRSRDSERKVINFIGNRSITLSKEECIDLPEKTYQIRKIDLPHKATRVYQDMLYDFYIEFMNKGSKIDLSVTTKLASLMKLRQITSGFIIKDSESIFLHDVKEKELMDLLDDIGNHQAIIWCQFQYEIERIASLLGKRNKKVVTAYGITKNVDSSISLFKSGRADYIIAHPKTLKYGVTLTNCTYAIYYSMSYSHEEYYQSHDRIFRKGQTNKCTYVFIQAENTIDEHIFEVVRNKKSQTQLFEMLMKDAEKAANT